MRRLVTNIPLRPHLQPARRRRPSSQSHPSNRTGDPGWGLKRLSRLKMPRGYVVDERTSESRWTLHGTSIVGELVDSQPQSRSKLILR